MEEQERQEDIRQAVEDQPTPRIYTVSGTRFYDNAVYTGSDTTLSTRYRRNYRLNRIDDVTTHPEVGLRGGWSRRKSMAAVGVIGFLTVAVLGLIVAVVVSRLDINQGVAPTASSVVQRSPPSSRAPPQTTSSGSMSRTAPASTTPLTSSSSTSSELSSSTLAHSSGTTLNLFTAVPRPSCIPTQFQCISDGRCIPAVWRCDNGNDCTDRSDEEGCGCPDNEVKCSSVRPSVCISMSQVCDGVADCTDYSDEENCATRRVDCSVDEFECIHFAECVGTSRRCDGIPDCRDQSDEWYNCSVTSPAPPGTRVLEVRLMQDDVDTTSQLAGRVEVRRHGTHETFETICDDRWTKEDAEVVCRMIVNTQFDGLAYAYTDALFGEGFGPIMMTNVNCYGNESNIGNCESSGLGQDVVFCSHRQDAGVSCGGAPYSTTPLPVIEGPEVRLVNGDTCLEGLVQVKHDDEWRFVCDDDFDVRDVTVVCRMLGFSAGVGRVRDAFGIGDGTFWLDDVSCQGNERTIAECPSGGWGQHDCEYYEAVGVECAGLASTECTPKRPCARSVTCSFDTDDCCYQFPSTAEDDVTTWQWNMATYIGYPDVTRGTMQGGIIYYFNMFGNAEDQALALLPHAPWRPPAPKVIEFYNLVTKSDYGALEMITSTPSSSSEGKHVLWSSTFVPSELEGVWLYHCVDIPPDVNYTEDFLMFRARRGPTSKRIVAVDDVQLSDTVCSNSIAHARCTFDAPSTCNFTITCTACLEGHSEYRWWWMNDEDGAGRYMKVDASYGVRNDNAKLRFTVADVRSKGSLQFRYRAMNASDTTLKIYMEQDEMQQQIWQNVNTAVNVKWLRECADISISSGQIVIMFEAIRGESPFSDIELDDIEFIHAYTVSCDFKDGDCGYHVESNVPALFRWSRSDIHSAPDDIYRTSFLTVDQDAPHGSWTLLSSPSFSMTAGQHTLTFWMDKTGPAYLQVYIDTADGPRRSLYSLDVTDTGGTQRMCIDVENNAVSEGRLGFESVKSTVQKTRVVNQTVKIYLTDIDITEGQCLDTLDVQPCTFEEDYGLCSFTLDANVSTCSTPYTWRREGGLGFTSNLGPDHTYDHRTGHVMAVHTAYGTYPRISTIHFKSFEKPASPHNMSVQLFFKIQRGTTRASNSELLIELNGESQLLHERLRSLSAWHPVCVDVPDDAQRVNLSVTARNIDAAIDDVTLNTNTCAYSVNCSFEDEAICGYITEYGWTFRKNGSDTFLQSSSTTGRIISPVIHSRNVSGCLTISARSLSPVAEAPSISADLLVRVIDVGSGEAVFQRMLKLYSMKWMAINIELPPTLENHVITVERTGRTRLDVNDIRLNHGVCSSLSCEDEAFACGTSYCIPQSRVCDRVHDCPDGADELVCDTSVNCTFDTANLCGYTIHNTIWSRKTQSELNCRLHFASDVPLAFVETPQKDVHGNSCLAVSMVRVDNTDRFRVVQNISGRLKEMRNFNIGLAGEDSLTVTLALPPGKYSVILEAQPSVGHVRTTDGLCVNAVSRNTGRCEGNAEMDSPLIAMTTTPQPAVLTTTAVPSTTATAAFRSVHITGEVIESFTFDDVSLDCLISIQRHTTVMLWYKDGIQLSRNADIINQRKLHTDRGQSRNKYEVHVKNTTANTEVMYTLVIHRVDANDDGLYTCVLDEFGIDVTDRPRDTVHVVIKDIPPGYTENKCYLSSLSECRELGYKTVTTPGPYGIADISRAERQLHLALDVALSPLAPAACRQTIQDLTCGLYTPLCANGTVRPACREECEAVTLTVNP